MKGISAVAAASVFALVQGCATQPSQNQPSADYASSDGAAAGAGSADQTSSDHGLGAKKADEHHKGNSYFRTVTSTTEGSVTVEGSTIHYHAVAGLLIVHPKGWNDAADSSGGDDPSPMDAGHEHGAKKKSPEASMFYVAYFKDGEKPSDRPITFLYNGGPGSSTVWLHMGAFGPRRVVTADHTHTPPAPYQLVNNDYSLLDASDLVFVDAPGTGFSRVTPGAEKDFYGADPDVHAFSGFIMQFLSKYGRWNSPKYLFGESYGTPRSANLINVLETEDDTDFNGVILLSQILSYDESTGMVRYDPGVDLPYEVALPSYAATAWYHHKLPNASQQLEPFLKEVEHFALTDYARALRAGSSLPPEERSAIAAKLHDYTGLPVSYIEKADLRIDGGEFEHALQSDAGVTTGRLDSRFSGPSLDPLSQRAEYDPQSAAISSAYVAAFNDYVRKDLRYGTEMHYRPETRLFRTWNSRHQPPGAPTQLPQGLNVMPDLANAMKYDPDLKIMLNGGYFDLATPFFEGMYEMAHLPMPRKLQANIEYHYYESGHMVYANVPALKQLHDNVAAFIANTEHQQANPRKDDQQ
ncbi:MAG: peptidase S10 [Gammaproteobacteria bacterium]|nr:peptidase S10 [Gammaproteobacteria bacterium]